MFEQNRVDAVSKKGLKQEVAFTECIRYQTPHHLLREQSIYFEVTQFVQMFHS